MSPNRLNTPQILKDCYQITRILAQGAHGRTLLAYDFNQNRHVVIKKLAVSEAANWKAVELFEHSLKTLKNLSHPQIPAFYDAFYDEETTSFILVQQRIQGQDLRTLLAQNKSWNEQEIVHFLNDMLHVLEYLHQLNPPVIHRDIKPSNIILQDDGTYVLIDFDVVQTGIPHEHSGATMVGTTGYMPPEQLLGRTTPANDIFALGITTIQLATATHPIDLPFKRARLDFRSLSKLSDPLNTILERMTDPNIESRFQTVSDTQKALLNLDSPALNPSTSQWIINRENSARSRTIKRRIDYAINQRNDADARSTITVDDNALIIAIHSVRPTKVITFYKTITVINLALILLYIIFLGILNPQYYLFITLITLFLQTINLAAYRMNHQRFVESGVEQQLKITDKNISLTEEKRFKFLYGKRRQLENWSFPREDLRRVYLRALTPDDLNDLDDQNKLTRQGLSSFKLEKTGIVLVDKFGNHRLFGQDLITHAPVSSLRYGNYDELKHILKIIQIYLQPNDKQ